MNDLAENIGFDESYGLPLTDDIIEQSQPVYNETINNNLLSFNKDTIVNNDALRLLLITIAIIIVLVCIIISTILFIFICLNRRRTSKRQEKRDRLLLPDQSEKASRNTSSGKKIHSTKASQPSAKTTVPSTSNSTAEKTAVGPFYYDNLDDIPYIDESRPTSFIDITRV